MTIIDLVRVVIWLTFILLICEGIAAVFLARYAARTYVKRHKELVVRIDSLERRLVNLEQQGNAHNTD